MNEIWKDIKGYEGYYQISNLGQVRSLDRIIDSYSHRGKKKIKMHIKGRILSQNKRPEGYRYLFLSKMNVSTPYSVHVLVLNEFVSTRPKKYHACHNNGDPSDNRLENLRWDTEKNNHKDKTNHDTLPKGSKNPNAKLKESDILWIRSGVKYKEAFEKLKISRTNFIGIKNKTRWSHI